MEPRNNPFIMGSHRLLDASQAALSNVYGQDLPAALRSMSDPTSLSPEERRKLSDRLGLTGTWMAPMVDISTHPLVLLGLAMTVRFPLPTVANLQAFREGMKRVVQRVVPTLEKMAPPRTIYEGTAVPDLLDLGERRAMTIRRDFDNRMIDAVDRWQKATNQTQISPAVQRRIAAHRDNLASASGEGSNRSWAILRRHVWDEGEGVSSLGYSEAEAQTLLKSLRQPIPQVQLSPVERRLADDLGSMFDKGYGLILKNPEDRRAVLEAHRAAMGLPYRKLTEGEVAEAAQYIGKYWPRMGRLPPEERAQLIHEYISKADPLKTTVTQARQRGLQGATAKVTPKGREMDRLWGLLPEAEDLKTLGASPEVVEAVSRYTEAFMRGRSYSLSLEDVVPRYIESISRTYAWTLPTSPGVASAGSRLAGEVRKMRAKGATPTELAKGELLQNVYIPMAIGRMTPTQLSRSVSWESKKFGLVTALEGPLRKAVPPDMRKKLSTWLLNDRSSRYPVVGENISGYLYLGALGGNPVPMTLNLLQPLITLIPTVGLRHAVTGYRKTIEGAVKYMDLRWSKGISAEKAIQRAWPEFHDAFLELDPISRRALAEAMDTAYGQSAALRQGTKRTWSKIQDALMFPFSLSETTNRMASFYASRAKGLAEMGGMQIHDAALGKFIAVPMGGKGLHKYANEFARQNVLRTQFGTGYLNRPSGLVETWSPWSQFTTFPLRLASFTMHEGLKNPGVLGRMLLTGGLAYSGARELWGGDVSRGLLFGGLPMPEDQRAFAPLPLVPPTLQIAGGLGYLMAGDTEPLRKSLPLLLPGGVAAARGVSGVWGGKPVAKFLGKPYADHSQRLPDGRVPLYSANGSLQGYHTPVQLALRGLGVGNVTPRQEAEAARMLMANRDRMRESKRDLMQALYENDIDHAVDILQQYERAYPRSGGTPVTKADIRSLHLRRDVSRIERLMNTMPAHLKPMFAATVSAAMGANAQEFMGLVRPPGVGRTIMEREPYRLVPLEATARRVRQSLHGMKLSEKMRQAGIDTGRQTASGYQPGGFTQFGGF